MGHDDITGKHPPTLESIAETQRALTERLSELDKFVRTFAVGTTESWRDLRTSVDSLTARVDGLRDDIGLVKGGHAKNAMRQNLARIADEFGFEFISEVPQAAVIGFSKVATARGEAANEPESFRNADMVMNVRDTKGTLGYVALEASFTVNGNDVRGAVRNADYLHQYTGPPAMRPSLASISFPRPRRRLTLGKPCSIGYRLGSYSPSRCLTPSIQNVSPARSGRAFLVGEHPPCSRLRFAHLHSGDYMIDPVHALAFSIHSNPGVYALLLGSGVSRASGIPTGWEVTLDLVRKLAAMQGGDPDPAPDVWYREKYGEGPDYSDILEELTKTPPERQ